MAYQIISPKYSFIRFSESSIIESASHGTAASCLPVYEADDVAFQYIVRGNESEANALCGVGTSGVRIGLVKDCLEDFLIEFTQQPQRSKINTTDVLFNWPHGLPDFETVIGINNCFFIKLLVDGTPFCSNCLTRIRDNKYTAVIEFGNEENGLGYNYCNGMLVGDDTEEDLDCDPTFISFFNQSTVNIPYTASLRNKYGDMPSVSIWIYNTEGELQNMGVQATFDDFPPDNINIDNGGPASGVIKIS